MIANEIVNERRRFRNEGLFLRLTLEKVYDQVDKSFLYHTDKL